MLTLRKYSVCRLCLCASHRLMDIFEDDCGVEFSLTEALNDLLRIEVDNTNGLPWQICSSCLDKLADFRLFKRRCWECKVTFESRLQSAVHLLDNSGKVQPPVVSLKNTNGGIQGEQIMQIAHVRGLVRVSKDLFPKNEISAQNNMHFAPEERENSTDFKDQEKSCEGVADGKNTLPPGNCHLVTENDAYPIQKGEEEAFHVTLEPIVEVPIKNVLVQRCNDEKEVEEKKSVESVHAESPCLCPLQLGSSVEPPSRKLRPARVRRKPFWACDDLPSMVARKRKNDGIVEENFMPASPVKGLVSVNKELVADSETSQNNVDVVTEGSKKLSQCDDIIENSCDREINLKTSQIFAKKESNCDITADSGAQSKEEKELVSQFKLKTLKILLDSLPPSILSEAANNLSPKKTPEHAAPEEITCTPETTSNEGFHSPSSRCVFSGEMFLPLEQKDKHVLDEENSIFCSEYTYQQARESKSSTMAARRLLEGVFTLAALQACSISGKPPRGKGRAAYNEGANIKPCLCPKAVNAIFKLLNSKIFLTGILKKMRNSFARHCPFVFMNCRGNENPWKAQAFTPEKRKLAVHNSNECCGYGSDCKDFNYGGQSDIPGEVSSRHIKLPFDQKEKVACLPQAHPMGTVETIEKYPCVLNDKNDLNKRKTKVEFIQQKHAKPSRVSPKSQVPKRSSSRFKFLSNSSKRRCSACFCHN